MAQAGHIHSKDASIRVMCDPGTISLGAHGNDVSIDFTADDLEATAYGDKSHTFLQGLTNYTISVDCWWAGSDTSDVDDSVAACMFRIMGESSTCRPMIQVNPAGSTAGSLAYAASVNLQNHSMSFPSDGIATMAATFTARSGSLTACADSIW